MCCLVIEVYLGSLFIELSLGYLRVTFMTTLFRNSGVLLRGSGSVFLILRKARPFLTIAEESIIYCNL